MTRPAHAFAPPPIRRKPTVKRDTMGEFKEKVAVRVRDAGCVAERALRIRDGEMFDRLNSKVYCDGRLEVDHVRASGALSKKSVTHRSNMVLLCAWHHKLKTEYGRTWRPLLLAYLARVEVGE